MQGSTNRKQSIFRALIFYSHFYAIITSLAQAIVNLGSAPFPFIVSFYGSFFLNSLTKPLILSVLCIKTHTLTLLDE